MNQINPNYYKNSSIECADVTEKFNFCLGNVIKYIWRAGKKGDIIIDLNKALWYLLREINRVAAENNTVVLLSKFHTSLVHLNQTTEIIDENKDPLKILHANILQAIYNCENLEELGGLGKVVAYDKTSAKLIFSGDESDLDSDIVKLVLHG